MKTKINGKEVLNNSTYFPHEIPGEVNEEASMTVPDQSYGINEIIQKHVRGMNLPVMRQGLYDEEVNFDSPDLTKVIDVTEVEEMQSELKIKMSNAKETAKNRDSESKIQKPDFSGKNPEEDSGTAQILT